MEICTALTNELASEAFRNLLIMSGVITAIVSVSKVQATAKKKQTADLLFGCRMDEQLRIGTQHVVAMHDPNGSIKDLLQAQKENSDEAVAVKYLLNHWERVCVGINLGIYHEEMLRQANRTNVVDLYQKSKPFIDAVRYKTGKDTFYKDFEALALKWMEKPLKVKKSWAFWAR